MPTDKPRIAGYIPQNLKDKFNEFKSQRQISGDSQALAVILSEFFEVSYPVSQGSSLSLIDRLQSVEDGLAHLSDFVASKFKDVDLEIRAVQASQYSVKEEVHSELLSELKGRVATPGQLELLSEESKENLVTTGGDALQPLSGYELAHRFGLHKDSVRNYKNKSAKGDPQKFVEWARKKDPDGIGWEYSESDKKYHPVSY